MASGGGSGEVSGGKNCMEMLKNLSREEILEVLSQGLCSQCDSVLQNRVGSLGKRKDMSNSSDYITNQTDYGRHYKTKPVLRSKITSESDSRGRWPEGFDSSRSADRKRSSSSSSNKYSNKSRDNDDDDDDEHNWKSLRRIDGALSEEEELMRCAKVGRKNDFTYIERIQGKPMNVLQGLELHTQVFNYEEQKKIVDYIFKLQQLGQKGKLRGRTYSEPRKWMRGKGRITIQFGCCYNYAVDAIGNPPGIVEDADVDPLPPLFKQMITRLVRWQILPTTCIPDSCIVNIYDKGDCIPPHIDHHDFLRPFCTVSFLSECNILFGQNLKSVAPGEFDGPVSLSLPLGSVLILSGNGADVAKHCIPSVPSQRISITFRKMDPEKLPKDHVPEMELMGIKSLKFRPRVNSTIDWDHRYEYEEGRNDEFRNGAEMKNNKSFPSLNVERQPRKQRYHRN